MARKINKQLARALADYDNLVKRFERERPEVIKRATKSLVEDLLPVLDNLDRARAHLKDSGLDMAVSQFETILANYGVEEIMTIIGDKFDNNVHEAIEIVDPDSIGVEGTKEQNGTIAAVLARGWKWQDGQVIRPAKVKVYGEKHV